MSAPTVPATIPPEDARRPAPEWLALIDTADRSGEFLTSYDLATRALAVHPADLRLQHRAVLALARSGATDRARALFRAHGLGDRPEEDVAALGARLEKDHALAVEGPERAARAAVAAERYEAVYGVSRGYYPAVNAASLWLLAGRPERAGELAREVLAICARVRPSAPQEAYWVRASEAEAALVLGDLAAVHVALAEAARLVGDDYAALGATRRQLRLLCDASGRDRSVLSPLRAPGVCHYTGHLIGRLGPEHVDRVSREIRAHLAAHRVGFGYGALASGADLLFAEALLDAGGDLHVVLPCDDERFLEMSVAGAGPDWVARFRRCRERARTVSYTATAGALTDDTALQYASAVAMGLAVTRARHLDTDVAQVAVWDEQPGAGPTTGTEADLARWRRAGLPAHVIACPPVRGRAPSPAAAPAAPPREVRAFLFGDVKGFSRLHEPEIPAFVDGVMGVVANALDRFETAILDRNTWGDGLFVVVRDVSAAAQCALDLQDAIDRIDRRALGMPADLALRVGAHAGPVFHLTDRVLKRPNYFGSHVTRAARIEPITPEGEVYVTEEFAALLALESGTGLRTEYVGHTPTAKGYGAMRMYVLKREPSPRAT